MGKSELVAEHFHQQHLESDQLKLAYTQLGVAEPAVNARGPLS